MITLSGKTLALDLLTGIGLHVALVEGPVVPVTLGGANLYQEAQAYTYTIDNGVAAGEPKTWITDKYVNIGHAIIHNNDIIIGVTPIHTTYAPGTILIVRCNLYF